MASRPLAARLGDADPPAAWRVVAEPPYIHVRRTKTAGWQVVHHTTHGPVVLRRRLDILDALQVGAAAARVNNCPLEVDR